MNDEKYSNTTGRTTTAELDHETDAVLALGREGEGAAPVERRSRCGEERRIPSHFVGIESTGAALERQSTCSDDGGGRSWPGLTDPRAATGFARRA